MRKIRLLWWFYIGVIIPIIFLPCFVHAADGDYVEEGKTIEEILEYASHPTFTGDAQLVDKKYVDSATVEDDSHAHTGSTLSGIDIGDDTNLAGTANEIILTGDTLSLHADITRDSEWNTAAKINAATTDADFLTVESDPVFTSWDKSTGISITESQISDFGTYLESESDPLALLSGGTDNVKDTHIDWGTGVGQVSADDIPDGSTNAIITLTQETNFGTAYTHSQVTTGNPHNLDYSDIGLGANQVIDWTSDQGATNIHAGNYTDTNTTYTASGTLLNLTDTAFSVNEGTLTNGKYCTYVTGTGLVCNSDSGAMAYPGAGIAVSTGSAWGASITNNSANWDTAYGWGNHASAGYLTGSTGVPKSSFTTDGGVLVGTGAGTFQEETGATLRNSLGLGTGDTPQFAGLTFPGTSSNLTFTKTDATGEYFTILPSSDNVTNLYVGEDGHMFDSIYMTAGGLNISAYYDIDNRNSLLLTQSDTVSNFSLSSKLDGISKSISFLNSASIDSFYPSTTSINLGTSTYPWGTLYASTVNSLGDLTINSDLGDVTSKLIFGRTTGGNGDISYDGTVFSISKNLYLPSYLGIGTSSFSGKFNILSTDGGHIQLQETDYDSAGIWTYHNQMGFGSITTANYRMTLDVSTGQVGISTTSFIGTEKLRVNGDIYADGAIKSASDITINSDLGDVTSKLIFGRTTGGSGELAYNGSTISFNKPFNMQIAGTSFIASSMINDNGYMGYLFGKRTGAANTTAQIGFIDADAHDAYVITTDTSHDWRINNATKMFLNSSGQLRINASAYIGSEKLRVNGNQYNDGTASLDALILREKSSDPADPAEGQSVIWQSDGTGAGDDGDLMVKITAGGVTKTTTLVDFSGI